MIPYRAYDSRHAILNDNFYNAAFKQIKTADIRTTILDETEYLLYIAGTATTENLFIPVTHNQNGDIIKTQSARISIQGRCLIKMGASLVYGSDGTNNINVLPGIESIDLKMNVGATYEIFLFTQLLPENATIYNAAGLSNIETAAVITSTYSVLNTAGVFTFGDQSDTLFPVDAPINSGFLLRNNNPARTMQNFNLSAPLNFSFSEFGDYIPLGVHNFTNAQTAGKFTDTNALNKHLNYYGKLIYYGQIWGKITTTSFIHPPGTQALFTITQQIN
jgi:hypothetical protein